MADVINVYEWIAFVYEDSQISRTALSWTGLLICAADLFTSWFVCVELDLVIIIVKPHWHVMFKNSSTLSMNVMVVIMCQSEPIMRTALGIFHDLAIIKAHAMRNPEACAIPECAVALCLPVCLVECGLHGMVNCVSRVSLCVCVRACVSRARVCLCGWMGDC